MLFNCDPIEAIGGAELIIRYIVDAGAKILYNTYLQGKVPMYTAEDIINWNNGVLQQQYMPIDKGESRYQMLNKWNDEEEPKNKQLDNIASISVKVDKPKVISNGTIDDTDDTKSVRSSSSRFSGSQRLRMAAQKVQGLSRMSLSVKRNNPIPQQQMLADEPVLETSYVWEFQEMPDDRPPPEVDPIADRLRDDREIKNKERQREQERMRKIREEQIVQQEKQKEMVRQLKHKLYTWDYDGEIVLIKQGKGSEPVLQVNEILSIDSKSKDPLIVVKENTTMPDIKPVREHQLRNEEERRKFEKAVAQEYPKQPPILEALNPSSGINIIFDNGYMKEGGAIKHDRISKNYYSEIIENSPRPKPQYPFNKPDEIHEPVQVVEDQEEHPQVILDPNLRKINIDNLEGYMMMMANETVRKSNSNSKTKSRSPRATMISKSKIQLQKLKLPARRYQGKLERVNAYKQELLQDSPKSRGHSDRDTKLHKAVHDFDSQIRENPTWGMVGVVKESKPTATPYQLKHNQLQRSTPSIRTQKAFFPPISRSTVVPTEFKVSGRPQRAR